MEEIEKSVSPLVLQAQEMWHFLIGGILRGLSLPQVIAIGVSLVVALLFHRWVRRLIMSVETRLEGGRWRRLFHTARIISLPITWVIGLWLSLAVLNATGHVTSLVRLVASCLGGDPYRGNSDPKCEHFKCFFLVCLDCGRVKRDGLT